jgi:glycine betaine/proline transport system permease protein
MSRHAKFLGPVLAVVGLVVVQLLTRSADTFPTDLEVDIAGPIDDLQGWIQDNRDNHWLFTWFVQPFRDVIDWCLSSLVDLLLGLPWFTLPALAFLLIARTGAWVRAVAVLLLMLFPGVVGLWEPTMATLALMIVSVGISVLIGVPLGIWSALDDRVRSVLRPMLDAMQTVPSTAYLVPAVLLFSIGEVPATVATVVFALPPVVRLTDLGIRGVPPATVEAGKVFGSSRRQLLTKVQLPQAVPSILTGVNQTINLALGIVVIAALVGAGGLGQEAIDTLRLRSPGRGFVVGGALVALALVLDRISRSFIDGPDPATGPAVPRRVVLGATGALAVAVLVGRAAGWKEFPVSWGTDFADPIDDAILWLRDNLRWLTVDVNDFIVRHLYVERATFLKDTVAWPVLVLGTAALGYWIGRWKLGSFCGLAVFAVGVVGLWEPAIETLVQVLIAVVLAAAIAIPLGIWAGRRPRVEAIMAPILDALQTIPPLTYAIPFVMIFAVGIVPGGIIASVLYALAPGIRVTALGIRQVPEATIEAATTFGATPRRVLWGVRVPLALASIMLALNQVILLVISMVIIAGLTGGGALGFLIIDTFTRNDVGRGAEVAIALTLMAMVLDRLTQGLAIRFQPPAASH